MGRRLVEFLATLPSTNARVAVTLLLAFGTGVKYWSSGAWEPSANWLTFLAAMSSIDGAVFYAKRKTHDTKNGGAGTPPGGKDG